MSPLLESLGAPVHWGGCMRFEKVISKELLESMQRGGCRMLLFGLETAPEPTMRAIARASRLSI